MKAIIIAVAIAAIIFVSGCSTSKTETSGGSGTLQKTPETPAVSPDQPDSFEGQLAEADQLYQNSESLDYLEDDLNALYNI